eukprot:CAMPEP_0172198846 /NCGR_PEP_ID=MMETSP1050-20130122/28331_1 /TAXON_ID=233186 /ORGANISM="Cryptomonas curvata, Strain CCAP979/52" /LENGTH=62 /DNA_ID=CAMNT_0012875747 /DNA_START=295 /DNA_END=480 /DNA_ORIENTATION=+
MPNCAGCDDRIILRIRIPMDWPTGEFIKQSVLQRTECVLLRPRHRRRIRALLQREPRRRGGG